MKLTAISALSLVFALAANADPFENIATYVPENYSSEVTECDRLAAHPDDPFKVAQGVSEGSVDLEAAIAACSEAVKNDPENPRLRYQLARSFGYSGRGEDAMPHRIAAVEAGYPQSLFVVGYLYINGRTIEKDVCRGAALIYRSAKLGRFAGLTFYPSYVSDGRFSECDIPSGPDELLGFLDEAEKMTGDSYKELLVETIRQRLLDQQDLAPVTQCAIQASHPDDPDKVFDGVEREDMDIPTAISVCQKAVDIAPTDARTNYHLGRALYYAGQKSESEVYLRRASDAGYRQAKFVLGYVKATDESFGPDYCQAYPLWSEALGNGHPWSGYHIAKAGLSDAFANCPEKPGADRIASAMCHAQAEITPEASGGRVETLYDTFLNNGGIPCQ